MILKSIPDNLRLFLGWTGLIIFLCAAGCGREENNSQRVVIEVKGKEIRVELASTPDQRSRGLKFRPSLPEDDGMLFVFPQAVRHPFWMKDTIIPLSIAFLNREGRIIDIRKMEPLNEKRLYHSSRPYRYALEMNQGWFERNGIVVGDRIVLNNQAITNEQ